MGGANDWSMKSFKSGWLKYHLKNQMCQSTSRAWSCDDFHNTHVLSLSCKRHCGQINMCHLHVPSVTQTSATECEASTTLHTKHHLVQSSHDLNKHVLPHIHSYGHLHVSSHLTCTMKGIPCRHCRSSGAKQRARDKHGKGFSVPMGQNRLLHIKTPSLTHAHLRSSPTHLHKGQSLWQPQ